MNIAASNIIHQSYKHIFKPIAFTFNPEIVHNHMTRTGEFIGNHATLNNLLASVLQFSDPRLGQTIHGIYFPNPIGLSAGFDYEARLLSVLPSVGFGFATVGTITRYPYVGNPRPILGRLPKSQSLMVNKGFKNNGIEEVVHKLTGKKFTIPAGISIGATNIEKIQTAADAVADIISAFKIAEKSDTHFSYYELNISCPNLRHNFSFYTRENIQTLLKAVDSCNLSKPLFIKMPISEPNDTVIGILDEACKHNVQGVILGNLQTNRRAPGINQEEVAKFSTGYFSGKPTQARSNELIRLAADRCGKKLTIIGCGGVFNAHDAQQKLDNGARLVQLITGMIFEGPQLIGQINQELSQNRA